MRMKRPKNRGNELPVKINESEFEGLSSFEEIDSYAILQRVNKKGGKKYKIIQRKSNKLKSENKAQNEGSNDTLNSTKPKDKIDKRKFEGKDDKPNKKPKYETVNIEAWKSIFVPDIILDAICELGFKEPTAIQKLTIPAAIEGRKDIVGAAETGSGKTLAFMIPIIHGILRDKEKEQEESESFEEEEVEEELLEEEIEESEDEVDEEENEESEDEVDEEKIEESEDEVDEEGQDDNEENLDVDDDGEEEEDDDNDDEDEEGINYKGRRNIGCIKVVNNANFDFMKLEDKEENNNISKLRALVITPTRELAVQIKKHTDAILTKTDIKTALVIGGLNFEKQERVLKTRPEIVIGTPGRLWEMIQKGNRHLSYLNSIRYLAVDETDRMLERGHFEELNHILEQMNCFPEEQNKRQNFIFSATLTLSHDAPKRLKQTKKVEKVSTEMKLENFIKLIGLRTKPKIIDITRKFGTAESLSETKVFCEKDEKDIYLYYFLKRFPGRTLIFCNSINCVKRLSNLLATLRCQPQTLHASKQQKQRLKSLERFAANNLSVLLATDVAARGIDIPGIKHIIHYEVPKTAETYVHRSGRTARANQEGLSVLLISSEEVNKYRQLCSTLNRSSDLPNFPVDYDLLENTRGRVNLAKEIELLQHRQNRKKRDELWFSKMKEEAELERDQSSDDDDDVAIAAVQKRRQSNVMKEKMAQLSLMLSKPLISSSFSGRYPTMSGKLVLPDRAFLNEVTEGAIDLVKQNKTNFSVIPKSNKPKRRKDRRNKKFKKNKNKS
ncbi:UNVERIFIED_CONTAM: hypothetical protein RMT77_002841 [Armadillidium vulgare]